MIFGFATQKIAMKSIVTAALASFVALATTSCVHKSNSGAADESAAPEIDPYAPAVTSENTGSDKPVTVDPMLHEEPVTETAQPNPAEAVPKSTVATASKTPRGTGSKRMMVTVARINLRSSPDRKSRITGELRRGDIVMVDIDETIGWAKVAEGEFIRARHLKSAEN